MSNGSLCFTLPVSFDVATCLSSRSKTESGLLRGPPLMTEVWVILVLNLLGFQISVHFVLGHCSEWSDSPERLGSFPYTGHISNKRVCKS